MHDLVERTSCLTVLSTSRLPLRLRAEHEIPVPPLEVPREGASADEIAAAPAVEMFVDRALAVAPEFRLLDHADDVADLCRFLDGLPLAIELAAAHARLLTPAQIRSALEGDLGLLTAHASDLPERQQTLAATIEWSYDRLDPAARTVADRLALFERGFTVEAVEAVCDDVPDVLAALAQIVEARLIRPADSRVEVRFVVLGTVRAYARTRLQHQDDLETRRIALADHLARESARLGGSARRTRRPHRGRAVRRHRRRSGRRARLGICHGPHGPRRRARDDDHRPLDRVRATHRRTASYPAAAGVRWSLAPAPGRSAPHRGKAGLSPDELGPGGRGAARGTRAARRRPDHRDRDPLLPRRRARRDRVGRRRRHAGIGGARRRPRASAATQLPRSPCPCWPSPAPWRATRWESGRSTSAGSRSSPSAVTWPGLPTLSTPWPRSPSTRRTRRTARAYASESVVIAGSALILEARDATITLARAAAVDGEPSSDGRSPPCCSGAGGPDRAVSCSGPVSSGRGVPRGAERGSGHRGPRLRGRPGGVRFALWHRRAHRGRLRGAAWRGQGCDRGGRLPSRVAAGAQPPGRVRARPGRSPALPPVAVASPG